MNPELVLGSALVMATAGGLIERIRLDRARRAIQIRIHVNGTRGKSTTTRLIRAALAEGGISALGKTTGTAARYIMPDGSEEAVFRIAKPSIREQIAALNRARFLKVQALVLECMAIKPELQWASEHRIVKSTIGVITNARIDHVEEMGNSEAEIALSLGNTIPENAVVFTADPLVAATLAPLALARHSILRLVQASDENYFIGYPDLPPWWLENAALAMAVATHCGVDRDKALKGILSARPDPGVAKFVEAWKGIQVLDASAANDPDSLQLLINNYANNYSPLLLIYNNRQDRVPRLLTFLRASFDHRLWITGYNPGLVLRRYKRPKGLCYVKPGDLESKTASYLAEEMKKGFKPLMVFCGNTKGWKMDLYCEGKKAEKS